MTYKEILTIERDISCRKCGSHNVVMYGMYKTTQYYFCNDCNSKFAGTDAYRDMKYLRSLVAKTLTYYYNGMSYQAISRTLYDFNQVDLAKSTLWRWVIKFSIIVNRYVLTLQPELSDTWVADETVIDLWGEHYWFWDIIDSETRFLIASHLSKTRTEYDAEKLFSMAKLRSKTRPKVIITDKLRQYHKAFNHVFYSRHKENRIIHLKSEGFEAEINTNLIERFHSTLKQRTKVMRDLKVKDSARIVLDGYMTHYNFLKEHDYLDSFTPAQASGITKSVVNWNDLIELALNMKRENPKVSLGWERVFQIQ